MEIVWRLCVVVTFWSRVGGQIQWEDINIVGVRLVNGSNTHSGRVELGVQEGPDNTSSPVWGTVCDDEWDDTDANIICRMLNYSKGGTARGRAHFGPGRGPIWLDDTVCDGRETHIRQCLGSLTHDCDHMEDAGVVCDPDTSGGGTSSPPPKGFGNMVMPGGECRDFTSPFPKVSLLSYGHPDIRSAGVVQVYLEGRMGSICDNYFDITSARVFCRLMCFTNAGEVSLGAPESIIGRPVQPFLPFRLQCRGDEMDMGGCIRGPANPFACGSMEAVTVTCRNLTSYFNIISDVTCKLVTDYLGTVWHQARVNATAISPCPIGYKGLAFRKCSSNATWEEPHYNQCVNIEIQRLVDQISSLNHTIPLPRPDRVLTTVQQLADATDRQAVKLTSGDIKAVVRSFPAVVSLDKRTKAGLNLTEAFVSVVSNVMTESTRRSWISIQQEKDSRTFITLLDAVTDSGFVAAGKLTQDEEPEVVVRENIVFEAGTVTPRDITFPKVQQKSGNGSTNHADGFDCRNAVSTNLRKATLQNIPATEDSHPYTAALYNTLAYLQAGQEPDDLQSVNIRRYRLSGIERYLLGDIVLTVDFAQCPDIINSMASQCFDIINSTLPSVSLHVESNQVIELDPPLEVIFKACVTRRKRSGQSANHSVKRDEHTDEAETEVVNIPPPLNCVRKEEKGNWIVWTTANCEVVKNNKDFTECRCKKTGHTASSFEKFLKFLKEFLAKYACLFPIFAVIFKILKTIYTECTKSKDTGTAPIETKCGKVKSKCALISDQPVRKLMIGLILCFIIIISNAELIAAVDKTGNRESCRAIAGTLHFFFLVECFYFMAQAVDIFLPGTLWIPWFLLLIGLPWVLSLFLVAVAVGSFSREDYLGENLCWLSKESGSYLFLIIPAAFVPMVQLLAFIKKSREQPCGCKGDKDTKTWQKVKTWVTEHKSLLEFGLGITLMSSQVFISLFAENDKSVMDVFFGLFTFAKGLILAITGVSEDEDSKKGQENQDLTKISDSTDDGKKNDSKDDDEKKDSTDDGGKKNSTDGDKKKDSTDDDKDKDSTDDDKERNSTDDDGKKDSTDDDKKKDSTNGDQKRVSADLDTKKYEDKSSKQEQKNGSRKGQAFQNPMFGRYGGGKGDIILQKDTKEKKAAPEESCSDDEAWFDKHGQNLDTSETEQDSDDTYSHHGTPSNTGDDPKQLHSEVNGFALPDNNVYDNGKSVVELDQNKEILHESDDTDSQDDVHVYQNVNSHYNTGKTTKDENYDEQSDAMVTKLQDVDPVYQKFGYNGDEEAKNKVSREQIDQSNDASHQNDESDVTDYSDEEKHFHDQTPKKGLENTEGIRDERLHEYEEQRYQGDQKEHQCTEKPSVDKMFSEC